MELYGGQLLKIQSHTKFSKCSIPYTGYSVPYTGFARKGARVRIITFRVTTRLQSKSNRCILHTTLVI
jgi:hypothetical protein